MLEVIFAIWNLLATWRFCVVLFCAVACYFALVLVAVPVGMPRVVGLLCTVAIASLLGGLWQRSHEHTLRVNGK
jgi:hypothetical protein